MRSTTEMGSNKRKTSDARLIALNAMAKTALVRNGVHFSHASFTLPQSTLRCYFINFCSRNDRSKVSKHVVDRKEWELFLTR